MGEENRASSPPVRTPSFRITAILAVRATGCKPVLRLEVKLQGKLDLARIVKWETRRANLAEV